MHLLNKLYGFFNLAEENNNGIRPEAANPN